MMKREYVCCDCGLIWFDDNPIVSFIKCPECNNTNATTKQTIFACDTFGWFYAHEGVKIRLNKKGKDFHYHESHPLYGRKRDNK